jgi:hypothetical protein
LLLLLCLLCNQTEHTQRGDQDRHGERTQKFGPPYFTRLFGGLPPAPLPTNQPVSSSISTHSQICRNAPATKKNEVPRPMVSCKTRAPSGMFIDDVLYSYLTTTLLYKNRHGIVEKNNTNTSNSFRDASQILNYFLSPPALAGQPKPTIVRRSLYFRVSRDTGK